MEQTGNPGTGEFSAGSRRDEYIEDGGYMNMLNRYGTSRDNAQAWTYTPEDSVDDVQLMEMYEGNGLFAKIIDRPAEEAIKHGLDLQLEEELQKQIEKKLDKLDWEDKAAEALSWCRLFGGAVIVMLVDDGRGLDEPLDLESVRRIEELLVFDRSIVQPDYISMYGYGMPGEPGQGGYGKPRWYQVNSIQGAFRVHASRCLVFRNGRLPERTTKTLYQFWGMPEYSRIRNELRQVITGHGYSVKMLEKAVQAIMKMKNLAPMLATVNGEEKVMRRLEMIDLTRSILSSLAIDADGEDYTFQNMQLAGVKDILDGTCNMLSAVTDIPQTILFGRSPAGENSTGDSDMENYYNMVERMQKRNLKKNLRALMDVILREFRCEGKISDLPDYEVEFSSLWSVSATEQADVDSKNAATELTRAQTAQAYLDMQAVGVEEVRDTLKDGDGFLVGNLRLRDDSPEEEIDLSALFQPQEAFENLPAIENIAPAVNSLNGDESGSDIPEYTGAAVLVISDGKVLIGKRSGGEGWCGPGGHIEAEETPEQAAIREAMEEFGILCTGLTEFADCGSPDSVYGLSKQFYCTEFEGDPKADGEELTDARFVSLEELKGYPLFPPFAEAVQKYREYADSG